VDALRRAGARVDDEARPGFTLADAYRDYYTLLCAAMSTTFAEQQFGTLMPFADNLTADDQSMMARFARGTALRHREWLRLHDGRERYRAAWAGFFRDHDVLVCPITPVAAIPHDHNPDWPSRRIAVDGESRSYEDQLVWAGVFGLAYLPATVAPVGRTRDGLPVGIQIVGPYLEDRTTIEVAGRLGELVGGFESPPGYA